MVAPRWLRWLLEPRVTITTTRTSSQPMSEGDWDHLDAAFAKMDEAFAELRKIGKL